MATCWFTSAQIAHAQCRDPWINSAYREVAGRAPVGTGEVCECNIKLYNSGSWNNYNELKNHVHELRNNGVKMAYKDLGGDQGNGTMGVVVMNQAGAILAAGGGQLIGNDSGGLVGNDGSTLTVPRSTPGFAVRLSAVLLMPLRRWVTKVARLLLNQGQHRRITHKPNDGTYRRVGWAGLI